MQTVGFSKSPMNNRPGLTSLLAIATTSIVLSFPRTIFADTIDFSSVPDGSSVSMGNPYDGILDLTATTSSLVVSAQYPTGLDVPSQGATIEGGAVVQVLPPIVAGTPLSIPVEYFSDMTATFLAPVTDVSFQLENYRTAGYTYAGFDSDGVAFSGSGTLMGGVELGLPVLLTWSTISLDIPQGGYLTDFAVSNRDFANGDAAFWVQDISYATVPDGASTAVLVLGGLAGLVLFRSRSVKLAPSRTA